jgi:hypothetical protein
VSLRRRLYQDRGANHAMLLSISVRHLISFRRNVSGQSKAAPMTMAQVMHARPTARYPSISHMISVPTVWVSLAPLINGTV